MDTHASKGKRRAWPFPKLFQAIFSRPKRPGNKIKEWKSWRLGRPFTIGLFIVDLSIIILIITLERISIRNGGLATVPRVSTDPLQHSSLSSLIWSYGLLWTALPSFLMALYRIGWDAIVSATAERQPYVDLNATEDHASTAGRTVMLDYRTYPILYNWVIAIRMKHGLIAFAMILNSILSLLLVPLTSHLLAATPSVLAKDFNATIFNTFNEAALNNADLQPALNIARAALAYNAEPPPWTTAKYSFEPFEIGAAEALRNYTVPVNAYYGQLDCVSLDVPKPQVSASGLGSNLTTYTYKLKDRSCTLSDIVVPIGDPPVEKSLHTSPTTSCGDAAHFSRIALWAGNPISSKKIENVTITSCIPSYWKTKGSLTVSAQKDLLPRVESFVEDTAQLAEFRPFGTRVFEGDLTFFLQMDPKGIYSADLLAIIAYEVGRTLNPGNPMDGPTLRKAMEKVWPSVFAYVTTTSLIQRPNKRTVLGQQMRNETRLFVYSPVAWTIVAILILVAICNVFLILHAEREHSILQEEPQGLLGAAVLLQDSDVNAFVARVRGVPTVDELSFRETVKRKYTVAESKCWYDGDAGRIRLTGLGWQQPAGTTEKRSSRTG
jgi:hypothetical protein